jgi:hypothetical protein
VVKGPAELRAAAVLGNLPTDIFKTVRGFGPRLGAMMNKSELLTADRGSNGAHLGFDELLDVGRFSQIVRRVHFMIPTGRAYAEAYAVLADGQTRKNLNECAGQGR